MSMDKPVRKSTDLRPPSRHPHSMVEGRVRGKGPTLDKSAKSFGIDPDWTAESLLKAIDEALPAGICITDRHGRFSSVSRAYCTIYETDPQSLLGQPFTVVLPDAAKEMAQEMHDRFIETATEIPGEWQVQTLTGRPVWVEVGAARFHDQKGQPYKVTTVMDVTARHEAEAKLKETADRLAEANDQKNRFFSIISHDLKNPFNALLGFTDLLANKTHELPRETIAEYARQCHGSVRHLYVLLANLLHWAQLQMERVELMPGPQRLQSVIARNIDLYRVPAEAKGVALSAADSSLFVLADADALDTVIRNLVNNAIKFTEAGGSVRVETAADGGDVVISVIDTGLGMDAETRNNLFRIDKFVSRADTDGRKGTGLGLLLCQDLTEKMGGRVSVESEPGRGSRFSVRLPKSEPPEI